jgi:hypothetical protein
MFYIVINKYFLSLQVLKPSKFKETSFVPNFEKLGPENVMFGANMTIY